MFIHEILVLWIANCAGVSRRTLSLLLKERESPFSQSLISHSLAYNTKIDMILSRNMTWGGAQGFRSPIVPETFKLQNFGVFGHTHSERKLTCEVPFAF